MATARLTLRVLTFLLAAGLAVAQDAQPGIQTEPLKADDIMALVADNQDRGEALRTEPETVSQKVSMPLVVRILNQS